jgi:predicted dehydrogenase
MWAHQTREPVHVGDSSMRQGQRHSDRSRRNFLAGTARVAVGASALAGLAVPSVHAAGDDAIRVALVGCGGRGTGAAVNALATSNQGPISLVAMADVFDDRLQTSHDTLVNAGPAYSGASAISGGYDPKQIDVPTERRFIGFDAYRKAMECLKPGDVVILTTPCAFRWVHFKEAIDRGLNVFMEKPLTVDGPTTRRMFELAALSEQKGLKVGVGLMCRHCDARKALLQRIQDGQIGDITQLRTYRLVGQAGFTGPKPADMTELMYQVQRYLSFYWASGGIAHDFTSHNVDECCWMKGSVPVKAQGMAGRTDREDFVDQNFDHYSVEFTFGDGANLYLQTRMMTGCHQEFASYAQGTKGSAVISTYMHTPAKCRIYKGHDVTNKDDLAWAFPQPEPNPYQLEWDHLIDAIRNNRPYNEAKRGTEASLVQLMGRMACHTGKVVTFEEALASDHEFAPGLDQLTFESPAPLALGPDGRYPMPRPGQLRNREF